MSLLRTLQFIVNHPLNKKRRIQSIMRFFKWQLNNYLNSFPIIYDFTDKAKLIIKKGMTGATGNFYCGFHDYSDMLFLLHFLREEDLFVDVGANIGSYTVLSSAHVGTRTISIEPVPSTFAHLLNNIHINQIQSKVTAINVAVGGKKSSVNFTSSLDTVNHIAVNNDTNIIRVKLDTLDDILEAHLPPSLLKIDVEGFETEVLKGATSTICNKELRAIIIEMNGSGLRYGYNDIAIHEKLLSTGFKPHTYDPIRRELNPISIFDAQNSLYLRDVAFVERRVKSADKVQIFDQSI